MSAASQSASDLSNQRLIAIVAGAGIGSAFLTVLLTALPDPWGAPGGPILQAAAALGSALLLASFVAVLVKRTGSADRRPEGKRAFHSHVWLASLGTALVFAHAASNLGRPPALLLALLALLIGLGVWSRTHGARRIAGAFGQKRGGFRRPDPAARDALARIVDQKRDLLKTLDPDADERLFSPTARHLRRRPFLTLRYLKLAAAEERLTGARAALGPAGRWCLAHRLLAWAFVGGLVAHVIIVMAFAGYAADGRDIYWLHFADWDF